MSNVKSAERVLELPEPYCDSRGALGVSDVSMPRRAVRMVAGPPRRIKLKRIQGLVDKANPGGMHYGFSRLSMPRSAHIKAK